nr:DUF5701 family protein [Streptomyces atratus]
MKQKSLNPPPPHRPRPRRPDGRPEPQRALPALTAKARTPLLRTEGIHRVIQQPTVLERHHCFMTIGSAMARAGRPRVLQRPQGRPVFGRPPGHLAVRPPVAAGTGECLRCLSGSGG